ncbi:sugar transferase [Liquorilactobacillus uvarum]|uniref:Beta-1,6-galactofuranosyltransferase n=1 Tax=Liquorilactobacillus uvarum DSM 19971 TaxID=1423812 RepID=A0A0R1Q997_9LACO|nr:sugar transferase [Liquorilactobacillus uvarum]KRL37544.1 hypothetical protein FD20_GL000217 [Liquorilactobacillus uvarum DSM 19971]
MTEDFVISTIERSDNDAGPKAQHDIIKFLSLNGYKIVKTRIPRKRIRKMYYALKTLPKLFKGRAMNVVIFQYPIYSLFLTKKIIKTIKKYTSARIILVIHDVESLRLFQDDKSFVKKELSIFNMDEVDGLIAHNKSMKNWLREKGITKKIAELEIFDYDNPQPFRVQKSYNRSVCFAGNLAKANFLEKLDVKNGLFVFGPNNNLKMHECIKYGGQYTPDELPKYLQQNYGLVWDGSSLDKCDGRFGEYLKYNAPHKTSLYLSSGIPVIVWKEAAIADFVLENNVGIVVDDLNHLDELLKNISESDFNVMKTNAVKVGKKMRSGYYIRRAIEELMEN